jgi:hypothetical protein
MKATKPGKSDHPKRTERIGEGFGTEGSTVNEGSFTPFVFFVISC